MDEGLLVSQEAECPCCQDLLVATMLYDVVDRFQVAYTLKLEKFSEDIPLGTFIKYAKKISRRSTCPSCRRVLVGCITLVNTQGYHLYLEEETDKKILEMAFQQGGVTERYWETSEYNVEDTLRRIYFGKWINRKQFIILLITVVGLGILLLLLL